MARGLLVGERAGRRGRCLCVRVVQVLSKGISWASLTFLLPCCADGLRKG